MSFILLAAAIGLICGPSVGGCHNTSSTDVGGTDAARADMSVPPDLSVVDASALDGSAATPENVVYPANSGVINVKTAYGATGDGVTDDTAAILRAIHDNITTLVQTPPPSSFSQIEHILYFPSGVYLISGRLAWQDGAGNWGNNLSFAGQSRSGTVFRLKDNSPGFADPQNPQAVIYTATIGNGNEEAYQENLQSFTVDTGRGNPGAIGIDWYANNQGILENVTIQSGDGQGAVGLSLARRLVGPCLVRNVSVIGFDLGVWLKSASHVTMKQISLSHQNVLGLKNDESVLSLEQLTSENTVPALLNIDEYALTALVGATLTGGAGGSAIVNGIDLANGFTGRLYVRNLTTSGYQSAIQNGGSAVAGTSQTEWVSNPALSLFSSSPATSLNLPIEETPDFDDADLTHWANVQDFGAVANGNGDDAAAIQAALDSGKPIVYFPIGTYHIGSTLHVRANVHRVRGFGAVLQPTLGFPLGQPALRIEGSTASAVIIERMTFRGNYDVSPPFRFPVAVLDASPETFVVKSSLTLNYKNEVGAGPVFLEDVCCGPFDFDHQTAWARQLNSESEAAATLSYTPPAHVTNNGGKVWIFGLKTEEASTIVQTTGGGSTEVLGAAIYQLRPYGIVPASIPAFVSVDSHQSLVYATDPNIPSDFEINVQETRLGVTRDLYRAYSSSSPRAYPRPMASAVPLYVGN